MNCCTEGRQGLYRSTTRGRSWRNGSSVYFYDTVQDLRRGLLTRPEHGNQLVVTDVAAVLSPSSASLFLQLRRRSLV